MGMPFAVYESGGRQYSITPTADFNGKGKVYMPLLQVLPRLLERHEFRIMGNCEFQPMEGTSGCDEIIVSDPEHGLVFGDLYPLPTGNIVFNTFFDRAHGTPTNPNDRKIIHGVYLLTPEGGEYVTLGNETVFDDAIKENVHHLALRNAGAKVEEFRDPQKLEALLRRHL